MMPFLTTFLHRQFLSEPPLPTASFKGKTVIVTGSNVGLGKEAIRWIVRLGATRVILACRNVEKGKAAAKDIQNTTSCSPDTIQVWQLDLSSYASVQAFCERANVSLDRLDVLIANAGIATQDFRMTEDNEETITTNVVSMFLHAFLLLQKLRETAQMFGTQTYLTVTGSELYELAKFKERNVPTGQIFATMNSEKKSSMGDRYMLSKLLGLLVVREISLLYPLDANNVIINYVAPGYCESELNRERSPTLIRTMNAILARPTEVGSRTLVYGASAGPDSHGQYLPDCVIMPTRGLAKGKPGLELQRRVWLELKDKLEKIRPGVTSLP